MATLLESVRESAREQAELARVRREKANQLGLDIVKRQVSRAVRSAGFLENKECIAKVHTVDTGTDTERIVNMAVGIMREDPYYAGLTFEICAKSSTGRSYNPGADDFLPLHITIKEDEEQTE